VLLMLGAYAALQAAGWPLVALVFTLGGFTAVGVALVMRRYRRSPQNLVLLKEKQP